MKYTPKKRILKMSNTKFEENSNFTFQVVYFKL